MTERELKKLNRYQLLEMLIIQTERADTLQKQLDDAQNRLDSRDVNMTVIGSVAEASLQLSGVFDAAQKAADIYLSAVQDRTAAMEEAASRKAEALVNEAARKAAATEEEALRKAQDIVAEAQRKARQILEYARKTGRIGDKTTTE